MKTLIILHGWQSSKEKWQKVKEILEQEGVKVIAADLPGFKPETKLFKPWYLNDYVEWLKRFIQEKEGTCPAASQGGEPRLWREPFFLLGHSFGGRVAIKFSVKYPEKLQGLILVSSAGIRKQPSLSGRILRWGAKLVRTLKIEEQPQLKGLWQIFRKLFYKYILRKTDYFEASGALKETIKNILNEDLTPYLAQIENKVLILWGSRDKITPLSDAELMAEKIKDSKLEILEKIGHTPYLENPELLSQKVKAFID